MLTAVILLAAGLAVSVCLALALAMREPRPGWWTCMDGTSRRMIAVCFACGRYNRIMMWKLGDDRLPKCGECHRPLAVEDVEDHASRHQDET